jgi:hypothetical protein
MFSGSTAEERTREYVAWKNSQEHPTWRGLDANHQTEMMTTSMQV